MILYNRGFSHAGICAETRFSDSVVGRFVARPRGAAAVVSAERAVSGGQSMSKKEGYSLFDAERFRRSFIEKYGEWAYRSRFRDFVNTELNWDTIPTLKMLLSDCMIRSFEWEGNEYNLARKKGGSRILIWNETTLVHGQDAESASFTMKDTELFELLLAIEQKEGVRVIQNNPCLKANPKIHPQSEHPPWEVLENEWEDDFGD